MANLVFKYHGPQGSAPPYGDPVNVSTAWGAGIVKMWVDALSASGYGPQVAPWVPTFEQNNAEQVFDAGTGKSSTIALNDRYFATAETATELMKRYGALGVALVSFTGAGGNVTSSAKERWLIFPGYAINAGPLAGYFIDNPEDTAPGVADKAVRHDIALAQAGSQQLPANG